MGGSSSGRFRASDRVFVFRGTTLGGNALTQIRRLIRSNFRLSREEIARRICRFFGWKRPNGELALRSCTRLLRLLEGLGWVKLPASRCRGRRPAVSSASALAKAEIPALLSGFQRPETSDPPLFLRSALSEEIPYWESLVERCHYLGHRRPTGESIRYVAFWKREPVALVSWTTAALHNKPRDLFIGWDPRTKARRLHLIANNARFLMLPGANEPLGSGPRPHLASRILSLNLRRLRRDWLRIHGHPVLLAETFVDRSRFQGTCYRASNWIEIGQTTGFSRRGFEYSYHGRPKTVFVYLLDRRARQSLAEESSRVEEKTWGRKSMIDVEKLPLEGEGGLFELLKTISDPRDPHGVRHPVISILSIAAAATLSGERYLAAIAQWAEDLPLEMRKRLGCRGLKPPSEPTIRRVLSKIDVVEVDRKIGDWLGRRAEIDGQGISIDGKTVRGSRDGEKPGVHLLSALMHREGLTVRQVEVSEKTNEIKGVKPLFEGLPMEGAVVTGDALLAQKEIATFLVEEKKADFAFTVKDNQPTLKRDIEDLHLEAFPPSEGNDG